MGVGLPAAVETSAPNGAEAALRSDLVQVRPVPSGEPKTGQGALRLTELLRCHYAQVWRTLRRFGVDEPFADDAAQQVFIVLSSKLDQVPVGCERKFLLSSAVRIASNYRQTWRRRHEVVDERALANECDPLPTVEQLLDEKRLRQAFDELLERWPADIRTAFVLFELEGLSVPEISELTETKLGTVSSRLRRARALFQAGVKRLKARGTAGNQP
jgi:RNA polymerase sigma-70 factor, ECF subfamily